MSFVTWASTGQTKQSRSDSLNEKLRSTCDCCASSKVRCNKQKPSCQRCKFLKLDCVYGPSRRKGRPGSNQSKNMSPRPDQLRSAGATSQSTPVDMSQSDTWCEQQFPDTFTGFQNTPEDDGSLSNFFNGSLWTPYSPQSVTESHERHDSQMSGSTAEGCFSMAVDKPKLSSSPASEITLALDLVKTSPDLATTDHLCISMAFNTLNDLYQLALCHQSAYSRQTNAVNPSSDQILRTNKVAVQNLEHLLLCDCITCSHDSNMAFILATIGSKILSWYRAVYNGDIVQLSSQMPGLANETAVTTTPLTIGDFKLDHIVEIRMKAQLLLCELQKLGRVFDMLAQRNRGRSDDLGGAEHNIYEAFEQFLRASLHDLVTKLDGIGIHR